VTRDFSGDDWRSARPGKWCALEILEHLTLTFSGTTRGMLKTMQASEPFCREATWRDRVAQFYVVELGIFPRGRKSPANVVPSGKLDDNPLRTFSDALVAMNATLNDAERRFGKKTKILDHPVLGPLSAEQWRRFHRVHAFHHLAQIAKLRSSANARHAAA
jgi:hypothetical protein